MSTPSVSKPTGIRALARVAGLVACALALCSCKERPPALLGEPTIDLGSAEPSVRMAIDRARNALSTLAAKDAKDASNAELANAYGELAMRYHVHDVADAAEISYRNARLLAPKDKRWPYLLGHLYNDTARPAAAVESFEAVLALDTDDVPALASLGNVALQLGDLDRAERAFDRLLKNAEGRPVALAGLGKVALARRNYPLAISRFEECLQLVPAATKVRVPLAAAYRGAGERDKAEQALRGFSGRGDDPSVRDPMADLLDSKIASSRGLLRRGQRFGAVGSFDLAAEAFLAATTANPNDPEAFANLGISLANLGKLEPASNALQSSLRLDPSSVLARVSLAVVLDRQGKDAQAITEYRAALAAEPHNEQALVYLADALMRGGEAQAAAPLYEQALRQEPSGRVRFSLAVANIAMHRFSVAERLIDAGLAASPGSATLVNAKARLLATGSQDFTRDGAQALALIQPLFEKARTPEFGQTLAMAMAAAGDFEHAIKLQEETLIAYSRMGNADAKPFVERNLALYREGKPARDPWPADDPMFVPRSPAVRGS